MFNFYFINKDPQELSFQENISFEDKHKDNSKTNETKEPEKNQSIFTKTDNNNHSFTSTLQSDKKDSLPAKTYKLDLKGTDNNKTFGNPFNKSPNSFNNNNQNNIKNNIVLINNNSDSKDNTNNEGNTANNNNNNSKDSKNSNILKKHESVSQFYN